MTDGAEHPSLDGSIPAVPVRAHDPTTRTCGEYRRPRAMAQRRLPGGVFDYIDGGAEDERSLARSMSAFADIEFVPRVLRDVSTVDTSTTLLGRPLAFPFVLAPTGFTRIADAQGELAVARAAGRADLPYTLSTLGTRSIEEVAAVHPGRNWFQVYVWKDRGLVEEMVRRAEAAGYEAIVPTVDLATFGRREHATSGGDSSSLPRSDSTRSSTGSATRAGRGTSCEADRFALQTSAPRTPPVSGTAPTQSTSRRTPTSNSTRR